MGRVCPQVNRFEQVSSDIYQMSVIGAELGDPVSDIKGGLGPGLGVGMGEGPMSNFWGSQI